MQDYLALEEPLIERVRACCAAELGLRAVQGVADLEGVIAAGQRLPAVYVLYAGERVPAGEQSHRGGVAHVDQRWYVVLALRNVRDTQHGSAWRRDAGPMLAALNAALQGWRAAPEFQPLQKTSAPAPMYTAGYGYFPLAYTARIKTTGVTA
jgi:hypothetical protein